MHNILVNALSVTNQSGMHVLCGHAERLRDELAGRVRLIVLARNDMTDLRNRLRDGVDYVSCPDRTRTWWARAAWEKKNLPLLAREKNARAYFTPSGIAASSMTIPQVVFCQNPWALVSAARRVSDAPKAWLQRRAYRAAMHKADVMVFNSRFMQEAYRRNAGCNEKRGLVVYQAPDDVTHAAAAHAVHSPRVRGRIVCVSAMGPHKNIEAIVRAMSFLRQADASLASLQLIGSWPDAAYEQRIRTLVTSLGLSDAVTFTGFVSREQLHHAYASASVFCLMSRCESFGIPAVEAQLFGTPVVSSNVCAVPEICGDGGVFLAPDDIPGLANALRGLLSDNAAWERLSRAARSNASRFAWSRCSKPLADMFLEVVEA